MARWAGSTTARGLGHEHQSLRAYKLKVLVDGTPCRRCGQQMRHPDRCPDGPCFHCTLDLGHAEDRVIVGPTGGSGRSELEHARCNRGAGGKLGIRLRMRRQGRQHTRTW